jgi:hypothetical protein
VLNKKTPVDAREAMDRQMQQEPIQCFKFVATDSEGRYVSIYDGATEYTLGETISQEVRAGLFITWRNSCSSEMHWQGGLWALQSLGVWPLQSRQNFLIDICLSLFGRRAQGRALRMRIYPRSSESRWVGLGI